MIIAKVTVFLAPEINFKKRKHLVEWHSFENQCELERWETENKEKNEYGDDYWSCYPEMIEDTKSGRLRDIQVKVKSYKLNELRSKPMSFFSSMPLSIFTKVQKALLELESTKDSFKLLATKSPKSSTWRPDKANTSENRIFFDGE